MKRNLLFAFSLLSAISSLPACAGPLTYSAEPIEARVIDAETQQPLEGVIVVAHWELEHGTVGGNVPDGQLMVMEVVTDKDGKFTFPAWGPKTVWNSFLVDKDPRLLLFKSGYRFQGHQNAYNSSRELRTHPVRRSDWNGKTIALTPFKGTMKEYGKHLVDLNISLNWAINGDHCEWKHITRMILALGEIDRQLQKIGVERSVSQIHSLIPFEGQEDKCGARVFFKEWKR